MGPEEWRCQPSASPPTAPKFSPPPTFAGLTYHVSKYLKEITKPPVKSNMFYPPTSTKQMTWKVRLEFTVLGLLEVIGGSTVVPGEVTPGQRPTRFHFLTCPPEGLKCARVAIPAHTFKFCPYPKHRAGHSELRILSLSREFWGARYLEGGLGGGCGSLPCMQG